MGMKQNVYGGIRQLSLGDICSQVKKETENLQNTYCLESKVDHPVDSFS